MANRGEEQTTTPWPPADWVAPTRHKIDLGALHLGALMYGETHTSTVLMLHGWADSAWSMDCLAQALLPKYRVIALDMRGHGHSGRGAYNMINLIADVREAYDVLELERPIVIGHSLGGQILAQFAGLYPDLPAALVSAEGTGPPPHHLAASAPDEYQRLMSLRSVERARQSIEPRSLRDMDLATERLVRAHPLLDPARARFLAERNTVRDADGVLWWRFDPDSRDWLNGHSLEAAAARWRGITCPVLVVNGEDSFDRYWVPRSGEPGDYPGPLTGAMLEERLSHFADVRYEEIAGAGHMLHYDKPDELNDSILRFLAEVDGR